MADRMDGLCQRDSACFAALQWSVVRESVALVSGQVRPSQGMGRLLEIAPPHLAWPLGLVGADTLI